MMSEALNQSFPDRFKISVAKLMTVPFLSRRGTNALFIILYSYLVFPKLVSNTDDLSVLVAVIPTTIVTFGLWFTFTNNVFR